MQLTKIIKFDPTKIQNSPCHEHELPSPEVVCARRLGERVHERANGVKRVARRVLDGFQTPDNSALPLRPHTNLREHVSAE